VNRSAAILALALLAAFGASPRAQAKVCVREKTASGVFSSSHAVHARTSAPRAAESQWVGGGAATNFAPDRSIGLNWYAYVGDNPVNLWDPDGMSPLGMSSGYYEALQASASVAGVVYSKTGDAAYSQAIADSMGGDLIRRNGEAMAKGHLAGGAIVSAPLVAAAGVEMAPAAGAACMRVGYSAANTALTNPAAAVTTLQTALAAVGLSTGNPPTSLYPFLGSMFNRYITQPTLTTIHNSTTGNSNK